MTQTKQHQHEAMLHPGKIYQSPEDVLNDNKLSSKKKIDVLNSWADIIKQKLEANAENMLPDRSNAHEEELLRKITCCLVDVNK